MVNVCDALHARNAVAFQEHPENLFGLLYGQVHIPQWLPVGFLEGFAALPALIPLIALAVFPVGFTLRVAIRAFHCERAHVGFEGITRQPGPGDAPRSPRNVR